MHSLHEAYLRAKDTNMLKLKGWTISAKHNQKRAGVAISLSDKINK